MNQLPEHLGKGLVNRDLTASPDSLNRFLRGQAKYNHDDSLEIRESRNYSAHRGKNTSSVVWADGCAISAPTIVLAAPERITAVAAASRRFARPAGGALWRRRVATAARQDMWRRLRRARGLAPVALVAEAGEGFEIVLAACWLDGAPAAPRTLDALQQILHDGAARSWLAWADRAERR